VIVEKKKRKKKRNPKVLKMRNGKIEREAETCQTRRRRFLALALRVVVSLILFQRSPPESCFFTISITRVPHNAPPICQILFFRFQMTLSAAQPPLPHPLSHFHFHFGLNLLISIWAFYPFSISLSISILPHLTVSTLLITILCFCFLS